MATSSNIGGGLKEIREGSAVLKVGSDVFYNNVQNVNRDFSVLALNVFADQWEKEVETRAKWKQEGVPGWRKSFQTWNWWGEPVKPSAAPAAVAKEGEEEEEEEPKQQPSSAKTAVVDDFEEGPFRILEAMSASGLRSIRYAKEIAPSMKKVVIANDREQAAVESIRAHAQANGPYEKGTSIEPSHADCIDYMHARRRQPAEHFHVVDLDPYGAPSEFLDSAIQCVRNGGLLCVTATDTAVLCGASIDKSRPKYGSLALHRPYMHEMAIRILLASIDSHAMRHGRFIVPQLSLKLDFYIRVFVRVHDDSAIEVKRSSCRIANVLQSKATDTFRILPVMTEDKPNKCVPARQEFDTFAESVQGGALGGWMIGGPIWSAPMHNPAFVDACLTKIGTMKRDAPYMKLNWADRVQGTLAAVKEELHDVPLYYSMASMCKLLHCATLPLEKCHAALMNGGYRFSQSHHVTNVVKTDAPSEVMWDILRCWVEKHPIAKKRLDEEPLVQKILSVPPVFKANFDPPRAIREARFARKQPNMVGKAGGEEAKPQAKWHHNPEKYWGPKSRADGAGKKRNGPPPMSSSDSGSNKRHNTGGNKGPASSS